jgi:hypothetical protein
MVLLLVGDLMQNPFQVIPSKTDHTIPSLPIQELPAPGPIDFMGATALHLPDKSADCHKGLDVDGQVNMSSCPANAMEMDPFGVPASLNDMGMNLLFNVRAEQREVILSVPVDVEVDFMEDMAGHAG